MEDKRVRRVDRSCEVERHMVSKSRSNTNSRDEMHWLVSLIEQDERASGCTEAARQGSVGGDAGD